MLRRDGGDQTDRALLISFDLKAIQKLHFSAPIFQRSRNSSNPLGAVGVGVLEHWLMLGDIHPVVE
jgi:hypothetical protein